MTTTNKTFCLLAGLCLVAASVLADSNDNPYAKITERNVFGLKDPQPQVEVTVEKGSLPAITLQGITTILGRKQALFKVGNPAGTSKPVARESWILGEGESGGEVTVLEINVQEGSVKFDNHGTVEVKNLKDFKPGGGAVMIANSVSPAAVTAPPKTVIVSTEPPDHLIEYQNHSRDSQNFAKVDGSGVQSAKSPADPPSDYAASAEPSVALAPVRIRMPQTEEEASAEAAH